MCIGRRDGDRYTSRAFYAIFRIQWRTLIAGFTRIVRDVGSRMSDHHSRRRRELVSCCAHAFSMLVVGKTSEVFCQPGCTLEHPRGVLGAG